MESQKQSHTAHLISSGQHRWGWSQGTDSIQVILVSSFPIPSRSGCHGLKIGWCRWGTGRQVKLGRIQVQTDTLLETHGGTFWQLLQLPSQAQYTPFFRFLRFYWRETFIRTHKWCAQNYFTKSISHIKDKYCTFRTLLQTPKIEAKNITTPTSTFLGWSEFLFPFDVDGMKETINVDLLNVTHTCTIWNILKRFEIHRLSWISLSLALSLSVSVSGSLWSLHFCCNHVKLRNFVANCWETLNYGIFCRKKMDSSLWAEKSGMRCAPSGLRILS